MEPGSAKEQLPSRIPSSARLPLFPASGMEGKSRKLPSYPPSKGSKNHPTTGVLPRRVSHPKSGNKYVDVKMIPGRFGSTETMSSPGELESHQGVPVSWEQLLLSCPLPRLFQALGKGHGMPNSAGKGENGEQGAADGLAELLPAISC